MIPLVTYYSRLPASLRLIVEREAQPYLRTETSQSVYVLQWQVVLFIQFLLLMDADMTNDVGAVTIGVTLLVLNVLLVIVIGFGARETVKRASLAVEKASRRTSAMIRRASALPLGRSPPPAAAAAAEVELGDLFPTTENPEDDRSSGFVSVMENPMTPADPVSVENPVYGHLHKKAAANPEG